MKAKKLLAALVSMAMLLGMFSVPTFAEGAAAEVMYEGSEPVSYETVQAAVDAVVASDKKGDITIKLLADPAETVVIKQQEGKNLTITAEEGVVVTSSFEIDGDGRYVEAETITFDGIAFSSTKEMNFITNEKQYTDPGEAPHNSYPHNIIVKNCKATGSVIPALIPVVLVSLNQYNNLTMENCEGTSLHSLLQSSSMGGKGVIDRCTLTDSYHGISLGTSANFTITNTTVEVSSEYAIRWNVNGNEADLKIAFCDLKAPQPLVVRGEATESVDVEIVDNKIVSTTEGSVLSSEGTLEANDLVAIQMNNNYLGGGAPVISQDITGVDITADAYYTDEDKTELTGKVVLDQDGNGTADAFFATIEEALGAAEESGSIISLAAGEHAGDLTIDKSITLKGQEGAVIDGELVVNADNVTIEDDKVKGFVRKNTKNCNFR